MLCGSLDPLGGDFGGELNTCICVAGASQVALVVKNLPANAGQVRDVGSIPGSGRSPGGEHGNRLQYSCLENPMNRGAWQATVHRFTQSQTQLKRLSMNTRICMAEFLCCLPEITQHC